MKLPKFFRDWNLLSQIIFTVLFLGLYLVPVIAIIADGDLGMGILWLSAAWIPALLIAYISAAILDFIVNLLGGSE